MPPHESERGLSVKCRVGTVRRPSRNCLHWGRMPQQPCRAAQPGLHSATLAGITHRQLQAKFNTSTPSTDLQPDAPKVKDLPTPPASTPADAAPSSGSPLPLASAPPSDGGQLKAPQAGQAKKCAPGEGQHGCYARVCLPHKWWWPNHLAC